jgi:LuxR family transcriptional regulator, maltose regulon positive regulatory protein
LSALAHANAFVQPAGSGWYRYHTLFAEVLRLKLRREHPDRMAPLHRRAARWYERNAQLTDAVRHAAEARDWPMAASVVIDGLAISEILGPPGSPSLAGVFQSMPHGQAWTEPQPYLVSAAVALSAGQHETSGAALEAAESILERLPADQEVAARLAAAMIRLAASRRAGDFTAAAAAATGAEILISKVPRDKLARHPEIRARALAGRGAAQLWSGQLDEAARTLEDGVAAATASGGEYERSDCLGHLALAEALRGRLRRAATQAARAAAALPAGEQRPAVPLPNPAALVALAWVHLERNELREAHSQLERAGTALGVAPDKQIEAVARLAVAYARLAEGRAAAAAQIIASARSGWPVPAWLEQRLSLAESQAYAAAGDIQAALAAAGRAGHGSSPETAVALAHAWVAAGDAENARRAVTPALATDGRVPERVRLQAWLVDAQLGYQHGDRARGRSSLASALRLAEPEQLRLPFVMERGWIGPLLQRDPGLADAHQRLLAPAAGRDRLPDPPGVPGQAPILVVEPLTEREQEVLRHFSGWLNTAEVATEMYISVNTVKTHLKSIYRKLAADRLGEAVRRARQLELI